MDRHRGILSPITSIDRIHVSGVAAEQGHLCNKKLYFEKEDPVSAAACTFASN